MKKRARSLTLDEFQKAVKGLRLSEENLLIAKQVLVDDIDIGLLIKKYNKGRQAIHIPVNNVWRKFLENKPLPKEWVELRLNLPREKVYEVLEAYLKCKKQLIEQEILAD